MKMAVIAKQLVQYSCDPLWIEAVSTLQSHLDCFFLKWQNNNIHYTVQILFNLIVVFCKKIIYFHIYSVQLMEGFEFGYG